MGKLNIPLVADTSKKISASYGVLITDEDDEMYGAALRGLFIIDPKGVVRSVQINDDAVGRSVEETLRILKAFQWADSHVGEACPASWTPGSDTIKSTYALFMHMLHPLKTHTHTHAHSQHTHTHTHTHTANPYESIKYFKEHYGASA